MNKILGTMKLSNILISLLIITGLYLFLTRTENTATDDTSKELEISRIKKGNVANNSDLAISPNKEATEELPEDIQKAMAKPESHDPNQLPPDLQAQLDASPPELPEDLKKQLALPPQELPEDLKAQLNSPPPELPEDIKKALSIPPRVVTLDEVNNPAGLDENAP